MIFRSGWGMGPGGATRLSASGAPQVSAADVEAVLAGA